MDKRTSFWTNTLTKLGLKSRKKRSRARDLNHRPVRLEQLEDRRLLSITVDSLGDGTVDWEDGNITLRDAIALAADVSHPDPDTIDFALSLNLATTPGEITLTEGELVIDSEVTITGPGGSQLEIDADGVSRVFSVSTGVTAAIADLTITGGTLASGNGAGILNAGTLALDKVTVANCQATDVANGSGGGIYNTGTLTLNGSTVGGVAPSSSTEPGNTASGDGGGIYNSGTLTLNSSTIGGAIPDGTTNLGNSAGGNGGGIFNAGTAELEMNSSTISGNEADATTGNGGGLYNSGTFTVHSSTIVYNEAASGAGIYEASSDNELRNTIVASNSTADDVSGTIPPADDNIIDDSSTQLEAQTTANEPTDISDTESSFDVIRDIFPDAPFMIVVSDDPGMSANVEKMWVTDVSTSGTTLYVDRGQDGTGAVQHGGNSYVTLQLLGPLQDNGGPTWTHQLLRGNRAIDAGDNTNASITDQRGAPRILDGLDTDVIDATIDIGAFEFGAFFVNYAPTFDVDETDPENPVILEPGDYVDGTTHGDGQVDADAAVGDRVTLRGAVQELNALPGEGHILFSPDISHVYLTLQGAGEELAATGDLDVTSKLTIRGLGAATTVIDGQYTPDSPPLVHLNDRIFHVSHGVQFNLESLTVKGGHAISDVGGAILNNGGTLEIVDSATSHSEADRGGGVYSRSTVVNQVAYEATVHLSDSEVHSSEAEEGGGIYIESGTVTVDDESEVHHNGADADGTPLARVLRGGGVYLADGTLTILGDSDIDSNGATEAGGGIYIEGGKATISGQSSVSGNRTGDEFFGGGGIYNSSELVISDESEVNSNLGGGILNITKWNDADKAYRIAKLTVNDSHIDWNGDWYIDEEDVEHTLNAIADCGGIYAEFSEVVVSGGSISNNSVRNDSEGDGIYNSNSMVTLIGTEVSNNAGSFGHGAAISNNGLNAQLSLVNCTFSSNSTEGSGGGVHNKNGSVTITNSTFNGNTLYQDEKGAGIHHDSGNHDLQGVTRLSSYTAPRQQ